MAVRLRLSSPRRTRCTPLPKELPQRKVLLPPSPLLLPPTPTPTPLLVRHAKAVGSWLQYPIRP